MIFLPLQPVTGEGGRPITLLNEMLWTQHVLQFVLNVYKCLLFLPFLPYYLLASPLLWLLFTQKEIYPTSLGVSEVYQLYLLA